VGPVTVGAAWRTEMPELRTMLELAAKAAQSVIELDPVASNGVSAIDTGARAYVTVKARKRARM
jgi:hypothetical protein